MIERKREITLVLGGGSALGFAHIGVLAVLEKHFNIKAIVGTSMGAVIGGAYALSAQSSLLEEKILRLLRREEIARLESLAGESRPEEKKMIIEGLVSFVKDLLLWNLKGIKRWIANGEEIKALVRDSVEGANFNQTKIPFACVACDLKTGSEVILNKGNMVEAVMASSSVPAVFPPVQLGGKLLIDGGTTSEVPVEAVQKLGVDFVIAINISDWIRRLKKHVKLIS